MTAAPVTWLDALASTQDEAHRLAALGAPHGTAVAARVQTGGRGTRGRPWVSGEGGLWLTVVCRPEAGAATEVIGLRVGLALAELLDKSLPPATRIAIKWPNDLYLFERKLGGILVEARWQGGTLGWMAIGVGINLRNEIPESLAWSAVGLADAGVNDDAATLAEPVARAVAHAARGSAVLNPAELRAFEARDWLRGRAITLPAPGVADGITSTGRLKVRMPDGQVAELAGTVELAGME